MAKSISQTAMYQRIGNMPKACPYVMMRPPIVTIAYVMQKELGYFFIGNDIHVVPVNYREEARRNLLSPFFAVLLIKILLKNG